VQLADSLRDEYEPLGLVMEKGWTSAELEKRNILVECIPLEKSFDVSWVTQAVKFIKKNNVKLIHSHEFSCNAYLTIAAKIARVPIICVAHGKNYYPEKYYRRFAYRRVAAMAEAFVAVSNDLKDFIVDAVAIPPKRIQVIHNGIDIDQFERKQYDSKKIRAELKLQPDDYVIIVVAALFEMKGHKDLLQAMSQCSAHEKQIKLLFVGDGDYRSELVKLTKQLNLENTVVFAGFRSDVAHMLAISDLFILPSYSEGLPVSVLEAMAARVPVIATRVGGLAELIDHGVNGYLVAAKAPQQLADTIKSIIASPVSVDDIREAAYALVCESFGSHAMLEQYRKIYRRLISA